MAKFKKGQSGNPNGRPKGALSITTKVKKLLDMVAEDDPSKRKYIDIFVERVMLDALKGNSAVQKMIWEQIDGKPMERLQIVDPIELEKTELQKLERLDNMLYNKDNVERNTKTKSAGKSATVQTKTGNKRGRKSTGKKN